MVEHTPSTCTHWGTAIYAHCYTVALLLIWWRWQRWWRQQQRQQNQGVWFALIKAHISISISNSVHMLLLLLSSQFFSAAVVVFIVVIVALLHLRTLLYWIQFSFFTVIADFLRLSLFFCHFNSRVCVHVHVNQTYISIRMCSLRWKLI